MSNLDSSAGKQTRMTPGAVAALILGITGCILGWAYGIPGLVCSIIGVILSRKARQTIDSNPGQYRGEKLVSSASTWSMVGMIQGIILSVVFIFVIGFLIASAARYSY